MTNITLKPLTISKENTCSEYGIDLINKHDPKIQLNMTAKPLSIFVNETVRNMHGIKVNIAFQINFTKDKTSQTAYSKSKPKTIIHENETLEVLNDVTNELLNKIAEWILQGSGWVIESISLHRITIIRYKPLRASSYLPLPDIIKNRKGLIKVKNENDNECFRWFHLAYMFPAQEKTQKITKYKAYKDKVDFKGITVPVKLKDVPKFEEMNDIRFNIFGVDSKDETSLLYP